MPTAGGRDVAAVQIRAVGGNDWQPAVGINHDSFGILPGIDATDGVNGKWIIHSILTAGKVNGSNQCCRAYQQLQCSNSG